MLKCWRYWDIKPLVIGRMSDSEWEEYKRSQEEIRGNMWNAKEIEHEVCQLNGN